MVDDHPLDDWWPSFWWCVTILELLSHGGAYMPNLDSLLCLEPSKKFVVGVGWVCKSILVLSFGPRFWLKTEADPSWTKIECPKKFWQKYRSQKVFVLRKVFELKKNWVQKLFWSKQIFHPKDLGQKHLGLDNIFSQK